VEMCSCRRRNSGDTSEGGWVCDGYIMSAPTPAPTLTSPNPQNHTSARTPPAACISSQVQRRRRNVEMCSCRRRNSGDTSEGGWACDGNAMAALPPSPAPTFAPTPALPEGFVKLFLWNVFWNNRNIGAMAEIISSNDADIIGLDEFTADGAALVSTLNSLLPHRDYELGPGTDGGWQGYGTDVIFDGRKWELQEGGKETVVCPGTRGGDRAANWLVVKERTSQRTIITGGIHLTYCAYNSCDATQECELGRLYDKLEDMKRNYANATVLWMGDLNHCASDPIIQNVLEGKIGTRTVFKTEELARTEGSTYYSAPGGCAIDHILIGGAGFKRFSGGRTGQGIYGQWLNGADHFPVYAAMVLPA